jgi:D-beta-D-heptose 7-phosphate kinase/D-beta-D-heptose 1-phosphate adenosyltransferase
MTTEPKTQDSKLVITNGCYDILHVGHIAMLKYAASLGDKLIVALDTDERVRENKSASRPINSLNDRVEMMKAIKYVDNVHSFGSEEELEAIMKKYKPTYLVIGDEYRDKKVVGASLVSEVKFFRKLDGYSTTKTIKNIVNR